MGSTKGAEMQVDETRPKVLLGATRAHMPGVAVGLAAGDRVCVATPLRAGVDHSDTVSRPRGFINVDRGTARQKCDQRKREKVFAHDVC